MTSPYVLRPLTLGETLDAGFKIAFRRYVPLLIATAVSIVPVVILGALVQFSVSPDPNDIFSVEPAGPGQDIDFPLGDLARYIAGTLVNSFITNLGAVVATGACTGLVAGAYVGVAADWKASLRTALRLVVPLLVASLLAGLIPWLGLLAFIVPGVILYAGFGVVIPVLMTEELGVIGSLKRSFRLVKGDRFWPTFSPGPEDRFWPTLGLLVILNIMIGTVVGAIATPITIATSLTGNFATTLIGQAIGNSIALVLVTPFAASVVVVLYYDLRVRKEAYDLELLAQQMGTTAPTESPDLPAVVSADWTPPSFNPNPNGPPPPGLPTPPGPPPPGAPRG